MRAEESKGEKSRPQLWENFPRSVPTAAATLRPAVGGGSPTPPGYFPSSSPRPRVLSLGNVGHVNNALASPSPGSSPEVITPTSVTVQVLDPKNSNGGVGVVDGTVPPHKKTDAFAIGSSLVVAPSGNKGTGSVVVGSRQQAVNVPAVAVTVAPALGSDPHIIHSQQITPGMPLPQGPLGPMVSSVPRPGSGFAVQQTPGAPRVPQPPLAISPPAPPRQSPEVRPLPGPGNYSPPLQEAPIPVSAGSRAGSGQQLLKSFMMEKEKQEASLARREQQQMQQKLFQRQQQQHQLKQQQQQQQLKQLQQQKQKMKQQQQQLKQQQQQQHLFPGSPGSSSTMGKKSNPHQLRLRQLHGQPQFPHPSPSPRPGGGRKPPPPPPRRPPHPPPTGFDPLSGAPSNRVGQVILCI